MCGIVSYLNTKGLSSAEVKQNLASLQSINHRGPDGEGVVLINIEDGTFKTLKTNDTPLGVSTDISIENYVEGSAHLFLGHRRLSIIDTSIAGHQPMQFKDRYCVTYNGEVYNYIEIRNELEKLGYTFSTHSDTEVILAAFDCWQEKAIERFNGMFAIVIFDLREKKLIIVNDRYGVKPLYYLQETNKLILVSEIKQFKNYSCTTTLNKAVINEYLKTAYLDYDTQTIYEEVKRFKPAHIAQINLRTNNLAVKEEPHYQLSFGRKKIAVNDAVHEFNELLNSAVALRMRSDVTVGCSLSGGLDSSAILVRAIENNRKNNAINKINTFSIVFPGLSGDESIFINLLVNALPVNAHFVNALEEFNINDFEKHIYHQDFPIQSTSYYAEWCLAKSVRSNNVTVLLNGQGGDEILAGYHHHFYRYCRQLILSGQILKYLSLANRYSQLKETPVAKLHTLVLNDLKLVAKFKLGLSTLGTSLENKWNKSNSLIEILKQDFTEYMLPTYLRSDDRDFMASHVETRHPFLDYRMVDFCNSLPDSYKIRDGWQKWLLREALADLPNEIRYRKDKKGYTTPQDFWMEKFKPEFETYLKFLPQDFENNFATQDKFLKYSLGAWFKVNAL